MKHLDDLEVYAYILDKEDEFSSILLFRVKSEDGIRWAVRNGNYCMNKDGEWEYEPSPSNRDDEFYKRCRFMKSSDAYDTYKKSIGE